MQIRETLPASVDVCVFGVSGAGKTSLINAISGLTRPQAGRIVLNGRVLNDTAQRICVCEQCVCMWCVCVCLWMRACFPMYVRGVQYGMAKSMVSQFDKCVVCVCGMCVCVDVCVCAGYPVAKSACVCAARADRV